MCRSGGGTLAKQRMSKNRDNGEWRVGRKKNRQVRCACEGREMKMKSTESVNDGEMSKELKERMEKRGREELNIHIK